MKQCPNCRNQITEDAAFCPICGTSIYAVHAFPEPYPPQTQVPPPVYVPPVPKESPYDHTKEYLPKDIAEHKLYCMAIYLLDFIGIIIALLAAKDSEYTRFHIRQGLKYCIVEILLTILAAALCWTFIVPILALIAMAVLMVFKFISFIQVCKNKAIEPVLICSLKFLN